MLARSALRSVTRSNRLFSTSAARQQKVTVLGAAGGIGQPLSLLLKLNPRVSQLALYGALAPQVLAGFASKVFFAGLEWSDAEHASRQAGVTTVDAACGDDRGLDAGPPTPAARPVLLAEEVAREPARLGELEPGALADGSGADGLLKPGAGEVGVSAAKRVEAGLEGGRGDGHRPQLMLKNRSGPSPIRLGR